MSTPALVIGGGLAGAGLAVSLANAGRAVTLVERETRGATQGLWRVRQRRGHAVSA